MTFLLDVNLLLVALARQHRLSLATMDEPLVRAFASESGLVQLVR